MAQDSNKVLGVSKEGDRRRDKEGAPQSRVGQYHPDRNPDHPQAQERFKEVQGADDTRSDSEQPGVRLGGAFAGFGQRRGPRGACSLGPGGRRRGVSSGRRPRSIFSNIFSRGRAAGRTR